MNTARFTGSARPSSGRNTSDAGPPGGRATGLLVVAAGLGLVGGPWLAAVPRALPVPSAPPRVDRQGDPLPPGALFRLGTARLRHPHGVRAIAFAPDGKTLASAGWKQDVWLWDLASGKAVRRIAGPRIAGPTTGMNAIAFTPDGQSLVGGGADGTVYLWEAATGREVARFAGHKYNATVVAFSAGRQFLASACRNKPVVRLWDAATGKEVRQFHGLKGGVTVLAVSRDGQTLAGVDDSSAVCLWEVATGRVLRRLSELESRVRGITFAPDGRTLATSDENADVRLWDAATGRELRVFGGRYFAFAPDGKTLATGGRDRMVRFWDPATGRELGAFRNYAADGLAELAFAPDGKTLALAASGESAIHLWDVATGQPVRLIAGHQEEVCDAAVAPDGRLFATASRDGTVRLWDAATGSPLRELDARPDDPGRSWFQPDYIEQVAFAPDGQLLAAARIDQTVLFWETASGKLVRKLKGCSVAFAPDGKLLACGGQRPDRGDAGFGRVPDRGIIRLYDRATWAEVRELNDLGWRTTGLAFSPDGGTLASIRWTGLGFGGGWQPAWPDDQEICLWEVASGRRRLAFGGPSGIERLAFSPDGRTLATVAPWQRGTIDLWETATGKGRARLMLEARAFAVAWAPDGTALAVGNDEGTVGLWGWPAARETCRLEGHQGGVKALAFAPGGKTVLSGSTDTAALVWDVAEPLARRFRPAADADAVAAAWNDLAGADAARAFQAIRLLVAVPEQSVPLLRKHLRPAAALDARQIERWLDDLKSERFATREGATRALERLDEAAKPALLRFLAANPLLEARRRAEQLLARLYGPLVDVDRLREVRALEVLEAIGSTEARHVLTILAAGDPAVGLTVDARAALERLAHRR
jgi:WD40 repeat protein